MSWKKTLLIALLLLFPVVIIPPAVYNYLSKANIHNDSLLFSGGITYPLYTGFLISRIGKRGLRIVLWYLWTILCVIALAILLDSSHIGGFLVLLWLPPIVPLWALTLTIALRLRKRADLSKAHLIAFLLLLPLLLVYGYFMLLGLASVGVSNYG
ncbi:MAG: hypothetical protein LBE82_07390 [Chitinophagaceae bacterium]|jgi:hypothetical protein|nr:hypothetical protein [Chitinophagaceae bacterium]